MEHDTPIYDHPIPEVADHPLFSGAYPVGLMAGEKPLTTPSVQGGDAALRKMLQDQGLKFEETPGSYGSPENSFIVHGPTREQMYQMGKALGQESVVYSNKGNHELLYTNGPNDGKAHPGHSHYGFHPTAAPADYFTQIPGKGFLRLYFNQDQLNPVPLQQPQAAPMVKSEPLIKRSKNVREQTRNITPLQAMNRRIQYAQKIGLNPVKNHATGVDFPKAKGSELGYGSDFPVEHETAHAMMTPAGRTIRQYQTHLNSTTDSPDEGDEEGDAHHISGTKDENIANQLENQIDRRSGVSPMHATKYRRVVPTKSYSDEAKEAEMSWEDKKATSRATDQRGKPGIRPAYGSEVTIPSEYIVNQADKYSNRFDQGASFDAEGRVQNDPQAHFREPEEHPLNQRINAGYGGTHSGRRLLREMLIKLKGGWKY